MAQGTADSTAVFDLRGQHIFLHDARKPEQKRQQHQKHNGKPLVPKPDDGKNTDDLACIGKHADNA